MSVLGSSVYARPADDTLVAAVAREILVLDNFNSTSRENEILSLLVDDALFYIDPSTQKPVPLTAKSYRYADANTLDVTLRDDVQFHDGAKLTLDDVFYTFSTMLNPKNTSKKADNFTRWLTSVEKVGTDTIRFNMKGPNPLALQMLATNGRIVKQGTYDSSSSPSGLNVDAQSGKLIGTGPYRVVSFLSGREVTLERFRGYRTGSPKGEPPIAKIKLRVIPDYSTQAAELLAGGVHWAYNIPTDMAEEVASTKRAVFKSSPSMRIGYVVLDAAGRVSKDHPLTKLKVRQALNYAVDRKTLTEKLVRGHSAPALTPCLKIQFGCAQDIQIYKYDPAKAKALLAEAGYPNGIQFDFWGTREKETLEAIVAMWRKVGINANLRFAKSPSVMKARDDNQLTAFFDNNGSLGISDVGSILPNQFGKGVPNDFHRDPKLYTLVDELVSTSDVDKRRQIAREAIGRINENAYWVPLYEFTQNFLLAPDLEFPQADDGMPRLFLARWKR
jgi:peptide/nickel transport system substrate-binding protein